MLILRSTSGGDALGRKTLHRAVQYPYKFRVMFTTTEALDRSLVARNGVAT